VLPFVLERNARGQLVQVAADATRSSATIDSPDRAELDGTQTQTQTQLTSRPTQRRRPRKTRRAGDTAPVEEEPALELTEDEINALTLRRKPAELAKYDDREQMSLATEINKEVERLLVRIDVEAVQQWKAKNDGVKKTSAEYNATVDQVNLSERELERLRTQRKKEFMQSFEVIQAKLREMYEHLAHGGDAELQLVESEDPFEGINFIVRPPRKSWKAISCLSGGEKTLSSLALVFALHHVRPTPVYVLDEIDAALDFRNVGIVARYILAHAKGAQFVIISLRNAMFELAHQLIGICKVRDVTKSIPLNPAKMQKSVTRSLNNQAFASMDELNPTWLQRQNG